MQKTLYINARFLTQKLTGVQRFAYEISKKISKISDKKVILLIPKMGRINKRYTYSFKIKKIGYNKSHLWEQIDLFLYLRKKNSPLLLNLTNSAPILYDNQISTIHDLSIYKSEKWYSSIYKCIYKIIIPKLIKNSHKIVTVSKFSKIEIINKFQLSERDIVVINNAVSFNNIKIPRNDKYTDEYILFIGGNSKRKNLSNAIKAFDKIKDRKLKFKIVGLDNKNNRLTKNKNIDTYHKVNDCQLYSLYSNAKMLVFPSFYEGFGIPPIEAMYLKCPVIVSDINVFRELYQDAVIYINPYNIDDIKKNIIELLDNNTLRERLIHKGLEQCKKYSWKSSSDKLINIINQF